MTSFFDCACGAALGVLALGATVVAGEVGRAVESEATPVREPTHFARVIAPIFEANCLGCHSAERKKGGLSLENMADITKGGDHGVVIKPGDATGSEMVRRLFLPMTDDSHMPPASKPQPKPEEIEAIRAWVAAGASFEAVTIDSGAAKPEAKPVKPSLPEAPIRMAAPLPKLPEVPLPPAASGSAIRGLQERFVHVEPIAAGSTLLMVDFSAVAAGIDDATARALLEPLKPQLAEVSLARTKVSDELVPFLAGLPNLNRLNLSATKVTDRGADGLKGMARLQVLVLTKTAIGDGALPAFEKMPALARVFLWGSAVTVDGANSLRGKRAGLEVDLGQPTSSVPLDVEPEPKFSKAPVQPPPATPGAAPAAAALPGPFNKVCPVTGQPINPAIQVVHKGRIVGLCCPKCAAEFLGDPAKYEAALK